MRRVAETCKVTSSVRLMGLRRGRIAGAFLRLCLMAPVFGLIACEEPIVEPMRRLPLADAGPAVAALALDGEDCQMDEDCRSAHCDNEVCCASGACCRENKDCKVKDALICDQ